MTVLQFPTDRVVGTLEWDGSWHDDTGPVLATGPIVVPDGTHVSLRVSPIASSARAGHGWTMAANTTRLDLGFLGDLPVEAIGAVSIDSGDEATIGALAHLAPGLTQLILALTGFSDAVLPTVARLSELVSLQTFGNDFTDAAVQQLAALQKLEHLYLEESTLSVAAFDFADRLPRLTRLGLQDVPISDAEVDRLRARLAGVDVG